MVAAVGVTNHLGWGLLHEAVHARNAEACARLLQTDPACVHARATDGDTPLHLAAFFGHVNLCELLVRHGAVVDAENQYGATPLMMATTCGEAGTCEVLLRLKADPNHADARGWTPVKEARAIGFRSILAALNVAAAAESR